MPFAATLAAILKIGSAPSTFILTRRLWGLGAPFAHPLARTMATYLHRGGRIVSVAVIVAVGVNNDGQREVLGMDIGSKPETFWRRSCASSHARACAGVKLVISDAHEGIKAAVAKVPHASWQRCRVHFTRNALAPAGRSERLNGEIKRRTDVVDEDAIICLVGEILLEQNDEWTVQRAPT